MFKDRCSIGRAVLLIKLVGELVQHDVVPVVEVRRSLPNIIPGENHHAVLPRLPEPSRLALQHGSAADRFNALGEIRMGIDQDRDQSGIVVGLPVQEQQARLGGDRDLDLVGQFQPAATLEEFLGEEDLDVPLEFLLVGLREVVVDWEVLLDDGEPGRWERLSAEPLATTLLEEAEHARPLLSSYTSRWRFLLYFAAISVLAGLIDPFAQHEAVIAGKLARVVAGPENQVIRLGDHNQFLIFCH